METFIAGLVTATLGVKGLRLLLIVIIVILILIAGLISSRIASKKDSVESLRSGWKK